MKLRSFLSDYFNWYQLKLDLYEFKMLIIITSKKITKKIYRKGNQGGIKMVYYKNNESNTTEGSVERIQVQKAMKLI